MFNKKLKERITELEKDAEINEMALNNMVHTNILLRKNATLVGKHCQIVKEVAEKAITKLEQKEAMNKLTDKRLDEIHSEVKELCEFKRTTERAGNILKRWLTYAVLPSACDSKLELTDSGFKIVFSPDNFNHEKFPEMTLSVFQGEYNLEEKIEMRALENKILHDIFVDLLEDNLKLGKHMFNWNDSIEITNKEWNSYELKAFIEEIVKTYRQAYSKYWLIINPFHLNQKKSD